MPVMTDDNSGALGEISEYDLKIEDFSGTFEQKKAAVAKFNLTDDLFFSVVMENKAACEYLLRRLMNMNVSVIENKTQYSLRNLTGHSVVLDLLVKDDTGLIYNVEVQSIDESNHERRMRYYISSMDQDFLKRGGKYKNLPETYVIFISKFDPFKQSKLHYEIEQYVGGTKERFDDGVHRHYFNTAVDDGSQLAELMRYLANSDPDDDRFGELSKAVRYHKLFEKGVDSMCEPIRAMFEEGFIKAETKGKAEGRAEGILLMIKNLLARGSSLEEALLIAEIDEQTYNKYKELYIV